MSQEIEGYPNLKPNPAFQDPDKAAEIGRKGGIASGVSRRRKANLKRTMETLLTLDLPDSKLKRQVVDMGLDPSMEHGLAVSLLLRGISTGDYRVFKEIRETIEQTTTLRDRQEQKARIEKLKAETAKTKSVVGLERSQEDDGFVEALQGKANDLWQED